MVETSFPWKKALVIGGSVGIGAALVRALASQGCSVAAVARRSTAFDQLGPELNNAIGSNLVTTYNHDVTARAEIPGLFQTVTRDLGGLDLIIYCAAVQPETDPMEFNSEKDASVIDVNLTGCIAWLNEAAVRFERVGRGTIVGFSSIAGDRGRRGAPAYGASKAGVATFLESLRNRLSTCGIHVTTIKPGFVDTRLTREKSGLLWLISADRAAELTLRAVRRRASTAYIPARWRLVSLIVRSIPTVIFRRLDL